MPDLPPPAGKAPATSAFRELGEGSGALISVVTIGVLFALGLGNLLEDGYTAAGWFLAGCLQLLVLVAVIGPAVSPHSPTDLAGSIRRLKFRCRMILAEGS